MISLDARGYRIAAWIGVVLLAAAAAVTLIMGRWWGSAGLAAFLVGAVAFLMWQSRLPALFSLLFVLAAILNACGWVFNFWDRIPYYDPVTHAYTTFATALALGFLAYYSVTVHFRERGWLFALSVASFGLSLGGLWEIFEWSISVKQTYQSVAIDLIADTLGALVAGAFAAWAIRHLPERQLRD